MAKRTPELRIACIGCGGNMRGHISRLVKLKGVSIVGLADPVPTGMEQAKQQYEELARTPSFAHWEEMLAQVSPDATVISTPHVFHAEQILASLAAGCHVLCEKPMTCTAEEARQVCAAAAAAGKVVQVSYQRHQMSEFRWMRQMVTSGALGPLEFIGAQQYQSWADHFRDRPEAWRLHPDQSGGGQLNDSGSHLVDILLHITDLEPRRVSCLQQSFDFKVDINSILNIEFEGGAQGSINIIGGARGISTAVYEDVTLLGSEQGIYYRGMATAPGQPIVQVRRKGEREAETATIKYPAGQAPDEAFVDVIRGKAANEAPPECGLRTIRLSEAAWRSASEGGAMVEV